MRHVRFRPPLPIYMLFHSKRPVLLMQCRLRTMFRHRTHFLQYKASVIVCIAFICRSCTVLCTESALFCVDTVYFGRYNIIVKAPKLFYRNPSCGSRRKPHPPAFVPLCPLCSRKTHLKKNRPVTGGSQKTTCFVNVKVGLIQKIENHPHSQVLRIEPVGAAEQEHSFLNVESEQQHGQTVNT